MQLHAHMCTYGPADAPKEVKDKTNLRFERVQMGHDNKQNGTSSKTKLSVLKPEVEIEALQAPQRA